MEQPSSHQEQPSVHMTDDDDGLDDVDPGVKTLTLSSKDAQTFELEKKNAYISHVVKTSLEQGLYASCLVLVCALMEVYGATDEDATEVPIPGVEGHVLQLVVEYMNHHEGVDPDPPEKPLRSKIMSEVCKDPWDATFIDGVAKERQKLYDLILVRRSTRFCV